MLIVGMNATSMPTERWRAPGRRPHNGTTFGLSPGPQAPRWHDVRHEPRPQAPRWHDVRHEPRPQAPRWHDVGTWAPTPGRRGASATSGCPYAVPERGLGSGASGPRVSGSRGLGVSDLAPRASGLGLRVSGHGLGSRGAEEYLLRLKPPSFPVLYVIGCSLSCRPLTSQPAKSARPGHASSPRPSASRSAAVQASPNRPACGRNHLFRC
jgi:hypothetical protein